MSDMPVTVMIIFIGQKLQENLLNIVNGVLGNDCFGWSYSGSVD